MIRGLTVARTFVVLQSVHSISDSKLKQAFVLGWCVEIVSDWGRVHVNLSIKLNLVSFCLCLDVFIY